jgi:hypothetical protein
VTTKRERERARFKAMSFWKRAERVIAQQLRLHGVPCTLIGAQNKPWDIVSESGLKIECKAARLMRGKKKGHLIRSPFWAVSIARPHGGRHRLREVGVDWYVIRLLGDDLRKIYLVLKAPLKTKQLQVTFRQLLTKFKSDVNNWAAITKAETRRRKRNATAKMANS